MTYNSYKFARERLMFSFLLHVVMMFMILIRGQIKTKKNLLSIYLAGILNIHSDIHEYTWLNWLKNEITIVILHISRSRGVTQFAANASLALGFMGLFWACAEAGDIRFIILVTCAILCGYVYQVSTCCWYRKLFLVSNAFNMHIVL